MTLALPDVTLCAVTAINHELTVRAMKKCLEHCSFADVVLVSSQPVDAPFRVEVVPPFSGAEYAPFVCQKLAQYTPSAYNLLVQYDSYIIEPAAWDNHFLDYDYIGAKWPWHVEGRRVGNSGFCLRSKKLLDILATMTLPPLGTYVDDTYICHTMRDYLEKNYDIRIAPEDIADRFAYERHKPDHPTFGFHGMFNFWRHADDAEMEDMIDLLDDLYVTSRAYAEILFHHHNVCKFRIFHKGYRRLRAQVPPPHIKDHLLQFLKDTAFIDGLIKSGEELCGFYGV
ncbi:MAG: DUF5672 family protein [Alphaproteobacteria bacterium]|nr:DUF5672 family protein [Alphaproteobacteria bacterium]